MNAFFPFAVQQAALAAAYAPWMFIVVPTLDGIEAYFRSMHEFLESLGCDANRDSSEDPVLRVTNCIRLALAEKKFPKNLERQVICLFSNPCSKAMRAVFDANPYIVARYRSGDQFFAIEETDRLMNPNRRCPCTMEEQSNLLARTA